MKGLRIINITNQERTLSGYRKYLEAKPIREKLQARKMTKEQKRVKIQTFNELVFKLNSWYGEN